MYYSPILFSEIADINLTQFHNCQYDTNKVNLKDKIIIYCHHSMEYLLKLLPFLNKVKKPFVIISAMEDTHFPPEFDKNFINRVISNKYFKHWFTINKSIPDNENFTSIPYGLDYWTLTTRSLWNEPIQTFKEQNDVFENIISKTEHFSKRIPKIYANFHLHLTDARNGGYRSKLINILPRNIVYYQETKLTRRTSFENMAKYSFVVSPFGNGFDCIRTFEALCLGCIVIMKKSFLDHIYEGLPVLIVNEWHDINEDLLNKTLEEYSNKTFDYIKLKMNYWIDLINSKFN